MSSTEFPGDLSPFRTGFLKVELFISGAWKDVTLDLSDDGVSIDRGREDASGQPPPSRMTLRLLSVAGKYSPRNPASPYYGLIGRNTPVRVSTQMTAGGVVSYRFWGEVTEWPQSWTRKGTVTVTIECSGVLRRLVQGATPLRSPMYRGSVATGPVAYWPMEDADGSTSFASGLGGPAMAISGVPNLAAHTGLAGSEPLPTVGAAAFTGVVPRYTTTSKTQVRALVNIPTGTPSGTVLLRAKFSGGSYERAEIQYLGGDLALNMYPVGGGASSMAMTFLEEGLDVRISMEFTQVGADLTTDLQEAWYANGVPTTGTQTDTIPGVSIGRVTTVEVNPTSAAAGDLAVGHVTVDDTITPLFDLLTEMPGHANEYADLRIERLATENGLVVATELHDGADVTRLGPQGIADLVTLMREAAEADGGILYEPRTSDDLAYRTRESMYSQAPTATITYTDNLLVPFEPVDDDQATRNVVTVTRAGGSSYTWTETAGPLGTAAVGVYDEAVTLSLSKDAQCAPQATWRAHLGTHDEARWPTIGVNLAHPVLLSNAALRDAIQALDLGDLLRVDNLPAWLPPQAVLALVQGYAETITPHSYKVEFRCTPARPYRAAYWNAAPDRYSGTGTVTAEDLDATETAVDVTLPTGVAWGHDGGDYDVVIGGELMTVTAVGTPVWPDQTLTVVRSVNGISKTHAAGAAVDLADPCFYGL